MIQCTGTDKFLHFSGLWDSFLEMRIRLQKALLIANRLPQKDQLASFNASGDENLRESYKQGTDL